jgi:hypothetical protein
MRRPSLLAVSIVAAALPVMAFATPVPSPVPVAGTFDRVASRGDFDVQVREGTPASIEILAEPGWAERIEVEVSGGELRLSRKKGFDSARGVLVKVVVPSFRGLSVGGSGKGSAESGSAPRDVNLSVSGSGELAWKGVAAALDLAVSGSGELKATGEAGPVKAAISGSGEMKLSGKGESLKASVSGSGELDAKEFAVKDANVSIAGSGDVDVRLAGGTLTAQIAGSGNLTWTGEGKLGAVATSGSGRVKQAR